MPITPATLPVLHRVLGIGLTAIAVVFLILRYLDIPPMLPHDSVTQVIGYTLSGLGVVLAAVALFVFKPRVPDHSPGELVEQYWSRPEIGPKVMMVWIVLEGAGVMAAVGYLSTGEPVTAIAAGVVIVAFWLCGPNVFAKA
jgi:hypothetical protein